MKASYRVSVLQQLRNQLVRFTPRGKKLVQINAAEELLAELVPDRTYSYEYIFFRITGHRPDAAPHELVSGEDAQHDLRMLIEDVSDSANVDVRDVPEPVRTVEQLGELFHVSTKTISRWRNQGLVSRRFMFNGRKRVGFLQSSVDRFVSRNRDRVERGANFSQLTEPERDEIIQRARRLARAGACPSDVIRRIAERMERSPETIRYTLREFDRQHQELAIFPERGASLNDAAKEEIFRRHEAGTSVAELARRHGRTQGSVQRILLEVRAKRIQDLPLDYIPSPDFLDHDRKEEILRELPSVENASRKLRVPAGLPPYLSSLYDVPLLSREQEMHLFRKMNFLKHLASELRSKLNPSKLRAAEIDEIERLYQMVVDVKNQIVQANLRLVVSIAKRHVTPADNFFELVSDGNVSLMRAVDKFDYARGNKFSTYASWAIMKNFARTIPGEYKYRDRFRTSQEEMFSSTIDNGSNVFAAESAQQLRELQIGKILARLDEREQRIIVSRFGLRRGSEPRTLKEVGEELGVTKERIRQIEARALDKLRDAIRDERIETT